MPMIDTYKSCFELLNEKVKRSTQIIILESNISLDKIIQVYYQDYEPFANVIPIKFVNTSQEFISNYQSAVEYDKMAFKKFLNYLQSLKLITPITENSYYLLEFDVPDISELGESYSLSIFPIAGDIVNMLNIFIQSDKVHFFRLHSTKIWLERKPEDQYFKDLFVDVASESIDSTLSYNLSQNLINIAFLRSDQLNLIKKSLKQFTKALFILTEDFSLGVSMLVSSVEPLALKYSSMNGIRAKFIDFLLRYFPEANKNLPNDPQNEKFKEVLANLYEIRNIYLHGGIEITRRAPTHPIIYNIRRKNTLKLLRIPSILYFIFSLQTVFNKFIIYLYEHRKDPQDQGRFKAWEKNPLSMAYAKLQQKDGKVKVGGVWIPREELHGRAITTKDLEHNFTGDYIDLLLHPKENK